MRQTLCAALGIWLAALGATAASAQDGGTVEQAEPGVVVELFTSQGCASCPPADEFMARLAERSDVIALALHVDYWDYIGWRDRFAQPRFTERQKAYAHADGSRSLFTPQMIVAGRHRLEGVRPMEVMDLIHRHAASERQVVVQLKRSGPMLEIVLSAEPPLERDVMVQMVRYKPQETVTIRAGENAGRTVTYHNIVTSWEILGNWHGGGPVAFHARSEGDDPTVIIVQEDGPGGILAAARWR